MRDRWRVRNQTLQLLADVGIHPTVHVSEAPSSHAHNRRNGVRAVKSTSGPVLYLEDDVIPSQAIHEWLEACRGKDVPVLLCSIRVNDLPEWVGEAVQSLTPIRPQFVSVEGHWSGSQAVYLPQRVADAVRRDKASLGPGGKLGPFDTYIRNKFKRAICAIPNPVQHVSPTPLVRNRPPRVSVTFAHPTKEE